MLNTCIGLHNPKSPSNVSAVMRAARSFAANSVFYTGSRYDRAKQYDRSHHKWDDSLPLASVTDLRELGQGSDMSLVAVELVTGAEALPDFQHPENACYCFGAEDSSLPQTLVDACEHVVYIPTIGCLNLAMTVNIVLYDRAAKLGLVATGDETIVANRDRNNTLVWR